MAETEHAAPRAVTFYDPHPGIGGAAVPLPVIMRRLAAALDGQTLSLDAALACLRAVAPGKVEAHLDRGWISFQVGDDIPRHMWRLIRFR